LDFVLVTVLARQSRNPNTFQSFKPFKPFKSLSEEDSEPENSQPSAKGAKDIAFVGARFIASLGFPFVRYALRGDSFILTI
jgi:hypothetical protein